MSYTYPVWHLSTDDIKNNNLADLFEADLQEYMREKSFFYDSLVGTVYHHKSLYDLLQVQRLATTMIIKVLRTNMSIVNSDLPQMDVVRLKDMTKKILTEWRKNSERTVHPYDNALFIDVLRKSEKWDQHPKLVSDYSEPADWNGIILSRLSDIHKNLSDLVTHAESRIIISVNRDPDQDIAAHVTNSILPAVHDIYGHLQAYLRFLLSL